ncbi:MAG TPA: hypothetical protein VL981_06220 [Candidatus Methylacidiphilales bacterium]|nr:hypothetical protein [Candidatus Methylacidiphilales bacterium]
MTASPPSSNSSYAVENTRAVLFALQAYVVKRATSGRTAAERAAIECFLSMTGRDVTGRTVRRWLKAVSAQGGIEKIPRDFFGAAKRRSHTQHPVRQQVRRIIAEVARLEGEKKTNPGTFSDHYVLDAIYQIARDVECVLASIRGDRAAFYLRAIRKAAEKISNLPRPKIVHEEAAAQFLGELLARLQALRPAAGG